VGGAIQKGRRVGDGFLWVMGQDGLCLRAVYSLAGGLGGRAYGDGLGGGGGGTPEVAENVRSAEVAEAAAHVGLPCAAVAVEAVWEDRPARVAREAWIGRAEGQRGTRFVRPSGGWCHADTTGSWGALRAYGVSVMGTVSVCCMRYAACMHAHAGTRPHSQWRG
jgi:hypothetical protein